MEYNGYKINSDNYFGLKVIKTIGPGKLPTALGGTFTNTQNAKVSIDAYIKNKEVKNGKRTSTG